MLLKLSVVFVCVIVAGAQQQLSNREITQICDDRGDDAFGSLGKKCEEFMECCTEQCSDLNRRTQVSTCEGSFYSSAEKTCACGPPGTGSGSRRGGSGSGDAHSRCVRRGEDYEGTGSQKCRKYKECCRNSCSDAGKTTEEAFCDGYMFSTAEKRCECSGRRSGGGRSHGRGGRGGGRGGSGRGGGRGGSGRGGGRGGSGGSHDKTSDCERAGTNHDGNAEAKCRKFEDCCKNKCHRETSENFCEGENTMFILAEKRCTCWSGGRGGGGRDRNSGDRDRDGGDSNTGALKTKCAAKASLMPSDKCTYFKGCCTDGCLREGKSMEEYRCTVMGGGIRDSRCTCGSNGDSGGQRRNGGSRGGSRGSSIVERCREEGENARRNHCDVFKRCCRRSCERDGDSVASQACTSSGSDLFSLRCECD